MDERKRQVLRAVVALYIADGEPIGSHLLSEYLDLAVSTATLRNEMAALTKLGLLEQPHTSAGRVPSSAGYRYYIDNLMETPGLTRSQKAAIDARFAGFDYDPQRLVQSAAGALSRQIGLMVAATTPRSEDTRIVHYELTQVGRYTVAVLAVTSAGGVLTRVAQTAGELFDADVKRASAALNATFCFLTPADIGPELEEGLARSFGERAPALMPVAHAAAQLAREAGDAVTAVEGIHCLLQYPEMSLCLPQLLKLISDDEQLPQAVIPPSQRLTVTFGGDGETALPAGTAVMAKGYMAGNGLRGGIAVFGPERMPYLQLSPILEYYALLLGQAMSGSKECR